MKSMFDDKETLNYGEGISVTIPFGEKRLETINLLAKTVNELAKALNVSTQVNITGCMITGAKTGIEIKNV